MDKYDKKSPTSYAIGLTVCFEAMEFGTVSKLYLSPELKTGETASRLIEKAKKKNIPVIVNNQKIFKSLSGKDNVMAIAEFLKQDEKLDPSSPHCLLVNPMNMGNMGTIIRSCLAFGVKDLAIVKPAADCFDPKVIRGSMGAFFRLRIAHFSAFEEYRKAYPEHNLYPFMLQAKKYLSETKFKSPATLIFGNEAKGLDRSYLEVGEPVLIKISGELDSLNLDNAVSIGLYELSKAI